MKPRSQGVSRAVACEALEGRVLLADVAAGAIDAIVFDDLNANGVMDSGEKGVSYAAIYMHGTPYHDSFHWNDDTNEVGEFQISSVPAGTYTLIVEGTSVPVSLGRRQMLYNLDRKTIQFNVSAAETMVLEIPVQLFARIAGRVREDRGGGMFVNLPGVQVYLDENNNRRHDAGEREHVTDTGGYWFDHIPEGEYTVRLKQAPPPHMKVSSQARGEAVRGEDVSLSDLIIKRRAVKLTGSVLLDRNGDGQIHPNARRLAGVRIHIDGNDNRRRDSDESIVMTDEAGRFEVRAPVGKISIRFIVPSRYPALRIFSKHHAVHDVQSFDIPFESSLLAKLLPLRIALQPRR